MTIGDANNNSNSDSDNPLQDHLEAYLEARERLEEFPGRVPQRRKKAMAATPSSSTSSSPAAKKVALQSDNSSVVITSQNQQNRHTKNSSNELISAKDIPTATENSHRSTAQVECKQKTKVRPDHNLVTSMQIILIFDEIFLKTQIIRKILTKVFQFFCLLHRNNALAGPWSLPLS